MKAYEKGKFSGDDYTHQKKNFNRKSAAKKYGLIYCEKLQFFCFQPDYNEYADNRLVLTSHSNQ
jgi:hypothetical protein